MRWLLGALIFLCPAAAWAACGPVPTSFPLTQTAVSSNFAKLYECINSGSATLPTNPTFPGTATFSGSAVFTGTATFSGVTTFNSDPTFNAGLTLGLHLPDGWGEQIILRESHGNSIILQAHDGALYISNGGTDGPDFGGTNLAITVFGKRGRTQQKLLVGPENSGGIGYRAVRVDN